MAHPSLIYPCRGVALGLALLWIVAGGARAGVVRTLGGEVFEGEIHTDVEAVSVVPKGQPAQRIDLKNILRADFQEFGKWALPDATNPGVQLRNGTIISGLVIDIDATTVRLKVGGVFKDFPLANVARVIFNPLPDQVARKVPPGFVGAILPGGDTLEGECRGMDDKPTTVKINSPVVGVHRFNVKEGEILAVAIHDSVLGAPEAYRVLGVDGSQYNVGTLQLGTDGVTLRDTLAGDVKIAEKQLAQILAGNARVLPLGTMRAAAVNSTVPTKVPAAFTADAMPVGGPITLAGQAYDGGIVQTAGVAVTYIVPAGFTMFSAKIGLPEGAPVGSAVFYSLLADNRPVWRSPQPVVAGGPPLLLRWNLVPGVRALSLYVEPAQPASLGVPAVWADAMLLKP